MLISKFDLYKSEWLELVFDNRNKAYGAYELRQHNGKTTGTAMAITFSVILAGAMATFIFSKPIIPITIREGIIPVVIAPYIPPPPVVPPRIIPHTPHVAPPASAVTPHVFVPLVITPNPVTTDPPKKSELTGPISSTIPTKPGSGTIDDGGKGVVPGPSTLPGNSNEPVSTIGLERMPEPFGGAAGWSKFLQRNLKYPDMAADQRAQGKVWVSFIVEKDGHLSNILVDRGAGYGMDEEAVRVLKRHPPGNPVSKTDSRYV
jgi:protein TonB